jgi:alpha-L-rhamnosidase
MRSKIFFCGLAFLFPLLLWSQPLAVTNLRAGHGEPPLGLAAPLPRLTWQLQRAGRGVRQTAYQVRVAADERALRHGRELVWDSGRVPSEQSVLVPCGGPPTPARARRYWQVRVWDEQGRPSAWSAPAWWERALEGPADWTAQWITTPWPDTLAGSPPAPLLRNDFMLKPKNVARARLYVTAHGLYEAYLNGRKVGDRHFTPGWTSYHQRLQYQTYDVTALLRPGANAAGVALGDGWYRGYLGWSTRRNTYGRELALLFQLEVTYADGEREVVTSGPGWRATTGAIRGSDLYNGETFDARLLQPGELTGSAAGAGWQPARVVERPKDQLLPDESLPVRAIEERMPARRFTTPAGETVYDFGQNLVGHVRLRVRGRAGDTCVLHHAEVLDSNGNFYTANLRDARQELRYILRGEPGGETYAPYFTFMGFRYVRVRGVLPEALSAVVVHSDMRPTGKFECSDSLLNRLQSNIRWGQRGNFVDVPTDCPQRDERLGWTGDAQAFVRTAAFNYDVAAFFRKWLHDLAADQFVDGRVPHVVPQVLKRTDGGSAGWADAATIIPWNLFLLYGDTLFLREQYASMQAWVDYMAREADSTGSVWSKGEHFGDWVFFSVNDDRAGVSAVTSKVLIAQSFFIHSTDLLRRAADVLGRTADAQHYAALADRLRAAYLREFVTPAGRLISETQTAYTLALAFDLLPENLRAGAADRLVENIRRYGHLTTGFLGTPHLCPVLTRFGYADVAFELLERKKYPSWLYPVTRGATTIWERWDGIRPDGSFQEASMNSFNHYAYGAIGDWLYRTVAGLDYDPATPGGRHLILAPTPGGSLQFARAELQTPYGPAACGWDRRDGRLAVSVTVPPNTTATVLLPGAAIGKVSESNRPLAAGNGIVSVRPDDGSISVEVGSGQYEFIYR